MANDFHVPSATAERRLFRRLLTTDWGSIPIVLALIVLWVVFWLANDKFLSPQNLTNLMLQIAALGTLATGIVLVLLLGEIDLSAAMVSGLCATIMGALNVRAGVPGPLAVLVGLVAGALIGLLQGAWITKLRIPSFIVTLAGFIAWQGALLWMVGNTGTISLRNSFILGIAGTFFTETWIGLALWAMLVSGYAVVLYLDRRRQILSELPVPGTSSLILRVVLVAAVFLAGLAVFYADRGLPLAAVIFIGLVIVVDGVTRRTVYGRHIYAVGGNAEAARRAGVKVDRIRISVFALTSTIAAIAGVLAASRLSAVNLGSGSSDLLLSAIAAAIIGGASLFGGRGSAWSAALGALVIGSISNGMDLLAFDVSSHGLISLKYLITAAVLLATVTIEVVSRRRRETAGEA
jgi:D-xylose transport system permease protein